MRNSQNREGGVALGTIDSETRRVSKAIKGAGGRAILVGGWVRDHKLGKQSKDIDIEIYGLDARTVEETLAQFGEVISIGRAFGVFRIKGMNTDFSLPRTDNKVSEGHRGFEVKTDPGISFEQASRRRDLTVNAMGIEILTGDLLDPHMGMEDLKNKRLKATDAKHFGEDPLRALRVAQLSARLEMRPDEELTDLCAQTDLSELPAERIFEEMSKLLLRSEKPSIGLDVLEGTKLLKFFPEIEALKEVEQDPVWHPEGDVWVHTKMVVDEAAKLRSGADDDIVLMLSALCHDLGKPGTTSRIDDRVRARGHEEAGAEPTRTLLQSWKVPGGHHKTGCVDRAPSPSARNVPEERQRTCSVQTPDKKAARSRDEPRDARARRTRGSTGKNNTRSKDRNIQGRRTIPRNDEQRRGATRREKRRRARETPHRTRNDPRETIRGNLERMSRNPGQDGMGQRGRNPR